MHRAVTLLLVACLAFAGARADGGATEEAASSAMDEQLSALKAQVVALRNRNQELFDRTAYAHAQTCARFLRLLTLCFVRVW
jgi:hypothetical protein